MKNNDTYTIYEQYDVCRRMRRKVVLQQQLRVCKMNDTNVCHAMVLLYVQADFEIVGT